MKLFLAIMNAICLMNQATQAYLITIIILCFSFIQVNTHYLHKLGFEWNKFACFLTWGNNVF